MRSYTDSRLRYSCTMGQSSKDVVPAIDPPVLGLHVVMGCMLVEGAGIPAKPPASCIEMLTRRHQPKLAMAASQLSSKLTTVWIKHNPYCEHGRAHPVGTMHSPAERLPGLAGCRR